MHHPEDSLGKEEPVHSSPIATSDSEIYHPAWGWFRIPGWCPFCCANVWHFYGLQQI